MKKIIVFVTMLIIVIACNRRGTSIKVNKTANRYELVAEYPNRKTERLEAYLKTALNDKQATNLQDEQISTGKEIKLTNGAIFYLRYNPGKLEIEMLVERNNTVGYEYFDTISKGVKKALN